MERICSAPGIFSLGSSLHTNLMTASEPLAVFRTSQRDQWTAAISLARHDFYHLPGYHALAEANGEGTAHLFHFAEDDRAISLPLLLRPLNGVEGLDGADPGLQDATSVYGYAGPLVSHAALPEGFVSRFQAALIGALGDRKVVSIFSRLHPLLAQAQSLRGLGECQPSGQTVSLDLALPEQEQRAQIRSRYRPDINRTRRLGVTCIDDLEWRYLGEFISAYWENMRRVAAQDSYFFKHEYFDVLRRELGSRLHLFVALAGGRMAAGALIVECDGIVQYHLGATRDEFLELSPMKVILDTLRQWGSQRGTRVLHLGGGVGSREDSLFAFKAGFSDRRHLFLTWRWTLMLEISVALAEAKARWDEAHGLRAISGEYFPAYRCPTAPAAQEARAHAR